MTTHHHSHHKRKAWLWWWALLILVAGGAISYVFHMRDWDPEARTAMSITISLTAIGVGVCVICATSDWWLKR